MSFNRIRSKLAYILLLQSVRLVRYVLHLRRKILDGVLLVIMAARFRHHKVMMLFLAAVKSKKLLCLRRRAVFSIQIADRKRVVHYGRSNNK